MRIVCDTNVLVRCVLSPQGAAAELLKTLISGHILITSPPLLAETLEVLRRPAIGKLHGLDDQALRRFISRLVRCSVVVPLPANVTEVVPRDSDDNVIVATAVLGKAEVLCTRDKHLLAAEPVLYCQSHGIRVLSDLELLAELRKLPSE
jgi:uncharacterized protein